MAQLPATQRNQGGRMAARREHPLVRLQRDFDTLFGTLWGGWPAPFEQDTETLRVWDFNVTENEKEIVVEAEIPGFEENELDVQLHNGVLTIKAEKEQKDDGREEYRSFFRSVTLPSEIDAEKAQATYRNGVLELHIPRAAGAQPKHIQLQKQQAATGQQGQQGSSHQAGTAASQSAKQGQPAPSNQHGAGASQSGKQAPQAGNQASGTGSAKDTK